MRILLINLTNPGGSGLDPDQLLPPFDNQSIYRALTDAGHNVLDLSAESGSLALRHMVEQVISYAPEAIVIGSSGLAAGHQAVAELTRLIRRSLPKTWMIYAGAYPCEHWREVLTREPQINFIVRGETEDTAVHLANDLEANRSFHTIPGIAYWLHGRPIATPLAAKARDLEAYLLQLDWVDAVHNSSMRI